MNANSNDLQNSADKIPVDTLLPALELGCWTAVALFPLLYYVNGSSVSTDQAVMRAILIIVAVTGAITLHLVNRRATRKSKLAHAADTRPVREDGV